MLRALVTMAILLGAAGASAKPAVVPSANLAAQPGDELTIDARVVDAAGVLSPEARTRLAAKIAAYEASTGRRLLVVTTPTLKGAPIEAYGARLFARAGLGAGGKPDGIALLVAPTEGQTRIEVGKALEDELTDIRKEQIASRVTVVHLRRGDAEGATLAAVATIIATIDCVENGACGLMDFAIAVGDAR